MEEIQNLPINEQIERFYKWYQQSENNVRQRVLLLDTRSENLLAIINKNHIEMSKIKNHQN